MNDVRKQVMAQIIAYMSEVEELGLDPVSCAQVRFPNAPKAVLLEAWVELDYRRVEAWWQSIEKTIDGEVITRALAKPAGQP